MCPNGKILDCRFSNIRTPSPEKATFVDYLFAYMAMVLKIVLKWQVASPFCIDIRWSLGSSLCNLLQLPWQLKVIPWGMRSSAISLQRKARGKGWLIAYPAYPLKFPTNSWFCLIWTCSTPVAWPWIWQLLVWCQTSLLQGWIHEHSGGFTGIFLESMF